MEEAKITTLRDKTTGQALAPRTSVNALYGEGQEGQILALTETGTVGVLSGDLVLAGGKITGLGTPTADTDAATKAYVDAHGGGGGSAEGMLPLTGGTLTGPIDMGTNKISNLGAPTTTSDAATKAYVDAHTDSTKLPLAGGTMTGKLTMANDILLSGATRKISHNSGSHTADIMTLYTGDGSGNGLVIQSDGRVIIGGGESGVQLRNALTDEKDNIERLYLSADEEVFVVAGCQTIASRKTFTFGKDGKLTAPGGFVGNLSGAATSATSATTATTCTGNAATATTLANQRAFSITGGATAAAVNFNGSAAVALNVTALNPSSLSAAVPIAKGGTGATSQAAALTALGGAKKPTVVNVTLTTSWSSNTQKVTVNGVVADEAAQEIHIMPKVASMKAYIEAGIYCSAQAANALTFTCTTVPTVAINVGITIWPLT